jgi:type I restriction enzyme S subunit
MRLLGTVAAGTMKSSAVHFRPGDVLYGRLRPYLNKVFLATFEGLCSAEFIVLPPSVAIDSRYLAYVLNSSEFVHFAMSLHEGDRPRVDFEQLAQYPVPVPPLAEQNRIISDLEKHFTRLDAAIAALRHAKGNLKRHRASVLMAACEGRLRADGEAWPVVSVGDIGEVKLGRQRAPKHQSGDHIRPYLRVANVFEDRIDTTDVLSMNFSPSEFETFALRSGDILLNEGQSLELVGRAAMYRDDVPGACFQNTLIRFRAGERILPRFALLVFRAWLHSGKFRLVARWTTNIAHLGANRLAEMPMSLPPIAEQATIVEDIESRLSRAAAIERSLDSNVIRANRLRQSILNRAFKGNLVAQDIADEPAVSALARAEQERAESTTKPEPTRRKRAVANTRPSNRRGILDTLRSAKEPLSPDKLFAGAGYSHESVDDFYAELKVEIERGAIREVRLGTSTVTLEVVEE